MICCKWLQIALDNMNANGISVVPRHSFDRRCFVVRFRWIDPALWKDVSAQLPQMTPFATAAEKAINFCPGCGTNLDPWIAEHEREFDALVSQVID